MTKDPYLPKVLPKKYGDKERFRPDEVKDILDIKDDRTLQEKDRDLRPVRLSERKKVYPRANLEDYLRKQNS